MAVSALAVWAVFRLPAAWAFPELSAQQPAPPAMTSIFDHHGAPTTAKREGPEPQPTQAGGGKWDTISVDGEVLSAVPYYVGGIVARDLAVLTRKRLILAGMINDEMQARWTSRLLAGVTPLSLAVFDTNGDGREEIFVNAWRLDGLHSMMFDKAGGRYRILAENLPYFFSGTPGKKLFAQKLANGGKDLDPVVYEVNREEGDLKMNPAFTIEGKAPLGLYVMDVDGDGDMERAGVAPDGSLLIYSKKGKLLWRAEGLGAGTKKTKGAANGDGKSQLAASPRLVQLNDKDGRPLLAVGSSIFKSGIFLGIGQNETGYVTIIRAGAKSYSVEKMFVAYRAWIGDLVDMSGGPLGQTNLPGYITINSEEKTSVIYLPPGQEKGQESSVSSGEPSRSKKGPKGR